MGSKSKIEWTDATWNPVTGCTKVSPGCANCYAERITEQWGKDFSKVILHPDRLHKPLHWKKPRMIFTCSMSDLFHENVPESFIREVWGILQDCPQHKFQVLTKRPERMKEFVTKFRDEFPYRILPNVWLGVSVEDQKRADERIPFLLETPAAIRFLSVEPLLGPIDFQDGPTDPMSTMGRWSELEQINWVIVGGESGPNARLMKSDWARDIRDQCNEALVPFFMKQMTSKAPIPKDLMVREFPCQS